MEKTPRGVFRWKAPGESVQDWFNSTLDGVYKHYYKVLAAAVIGVLALAFLALAAVNHYGSIRDPATCGMCHTTYYNYADYAPYPHQEPERGVTVGCGECHPYPFKEFRKSVHFTAVNGSRGEGAQIYKDKCSLCHGADGTPVIPGAPLFTKGERLEKTDSELAAAIKKGVGAMPGFEGQLTDKQLEQVVAHLRTLKK